MPGPVPKRDEERRRRNKPTTETIKVDLSESTAQQIEIPSPPVDPDSGELLWHPIAERWYMSLARSGQAIFYEPSDWETAYVLAEALSRELIPHDVRVGQREVLDPDRPYDSEGKANKIGQDFLFEKKLETISASSLTAFLKGATALMTTEGDRRRLRIELDRAKQRDAANAEGSNVIPIAKEREDRFKRGAR